MRRRKKQPVSANVIASWRTQFSLLHEKLAQSPESGDAWFWHVQWHILNYLLHRYAGDEKQAPPLPVSALTANPSHAARAPTLDFKPSETFSSTSESYGKMPRSAGQFRSVLQDIAHGNQDRHQTLEQQRQNESEAIRIEHEWRRGLMFKYMIVSDALIETGLPDPLFPNDDTLEAFEQLLADIELPRSASGIFNEVTPTCEMDEEMVARGVPLKNSSAEFKRVLIRILKARLRDQKRIRNIHGPDDFDKDPPSKD